MPTVTYEVPTLKGNAELDRYGELDGNALLRAILAADGSTITLFLANLAEVQNKRFDDANARFDLVAKTISILDKDILPKVTLTGFKAHANTDPKTRYSRPTVASAGEGCEAPYCDLAGKFRLPEAPEGAWKSYRLACQKHSVEALTSQASILADRKQSHIYLRSDQSRQISDHVRTGLKAVKA